MPHEADQALEQMMTSYVNGSGMLGPFHGGRRLYRLSTVVAGSTPAAFHVAVVQR